MRKVKYVLRYQTVRHHPGRPGKSCLEEQIPECFNCVVRSRYHGRILTETLPVEDLDLSKYPGYACLGEIFCPHGDPGGCSRPCVRRITSTLNQAVGYNYFDEPESSDTELSEAECTSNSSAATTSASDEEDVSSDTASTEAEQKSEQTSGTSSTYGVQEFLDELPRLDRPALAIFCNYLAFQEMKKTCSPFAESVDAAGWDEEAAQLGGDAPPRVLCFIQGSADPEVDDGQPSSTNPTFQSIYSPIPPSDDSESSDSADELELSIIPSKNLCTILRHRLQERLQEEIQNRVQHAFAKAAKKLSKPPAGSPGPLPAPASSLSSDPDSQGGSVPLIELPDQDNHAALINLDGQWDYDEDDSEVAALTARTSQLATSPSRIMGPRPSSPTPPGFTRVSKKRRRRTRKPRPRRKPDPGRQNPEFSEDSERSFPPDIASTSRFYICGEPDDVDDDENYVELEQYDKNYSSELTFDNSPARKLRSGSPGDLRKYVKCQCLPDQSCWCKQPGDYDNFLVDEAGQLTVRPDPSRIFIDRVKRARLEREEAKCRLANILAASAYSTWDSRDQGRRRWFAFDGRPLNSKMLPVFTDEEVAELRRGRYKDLPDLLRDCWGRKYEDYPTDQSEFAWLYDESTYQFDNTFKRPRKKS